MIKLIPFETSSQVKLRRWGSQFVQILLVIVVLSLLLGGFLGQPILLSFVETGSMEPTLEPGDGFVAIPSQVSGEVQQNDVIVFEAQHLNGGGLTTHRVVGETEAGYITRGDANPFTDQDGDEPPVTDAQIVAEALQINGWVVTIPSLGAFVWGIQEVTGALQQELALLFGTDMFLGTNGVAFLISSIGLVIVIYGLLFDDQSRRRDTGRSRRRNGIYDPRRAIVALTLFMLLVSGGTMVAMSTTHEYGMISASFDSEQPTTVPVGDESSFKHSAINGGQLPVYAFYEPASSNVDVQPHSTRMNRSEVKNVTVTLQAPDETGFYPQYVSEHRYFAVLPFGVVSTLYAIHPWVPIVATSLLFGLPLFVVGVAVLGTRPVRTRSTSRERDSWF